MLLCREWGPPCQGLHLWVDQMGYQTHVAAQNDHKELWCLLHWANPTKMGDWRMFKEYYVDTLKMGQKKDNTDWELAKVLCSVSEQIRMLFLL